MGGVVWRAEWRTKMNCKWFFFCPKKQRDLGRNVRANHWTSGVSVWSPGLFDQPCKKSVCWVALWLRLIPLFQTFFPDFHMEDHFLERHHKTLPMKKTSWSSLATIYNVRKSGWTHADPSFSGRLRPGNRLRPLTTGLLKITQRETEADREREREMNGLKCLSISSELVTFFSQQISISLLFHWIHSPAENVTQKTQMSGNILMINSSWKVSMPQHTNCLFQNEKICERQLVCSHMHTQEGTWVHQRERTRKLIL